MLDPSELAAHIGENDVLDTFAGHGWGIACKWLGLREHGIEKMSEAVAVRTANGMETVLLDVWDGLAPEVPPLRYRLHISSPPCQTFSMAGGGAGRKSLADVLQAIDDGAYEDVARLRELGAKVGDERTALVLAPLAYVWRDRPPHVIFEQVPQVLPVWIAIAGVLRSIGYSVWTGVLDAEQYGVPQTRDRAILIARNDGRVARPPQPTHSKFYERDKGRLDPGVEPWISMRSALGWGRSEARVQHSNYSAGGKPGQTAAERGRVVRADDLPSTTIASKAHSFYVAGAQTNQAVRAIDEPAPTLAFGHDSAQAKFLDDDPRDVRDAARSQVLTGQNSRQARGETKRYSRETDSPSPTVTGQTRSWRATTIDDGLIPLDEVSAEPAEQVETPWDDLFKDQSGSPVDPEWPDKRPATTVTSRAIVPNPGHNQRRHDDATKTRNDGVRITVLEAATLQSYPPDFVWDAEYTDPKGRTKPVSKTSQYQQVGNAVPPMLARACIAEVLSEEAPERDHWDHVFSEVSG